MVTLSRGSANQNRNVIYFYILEIRKIIRKYQIFTKIHIHTNTHTHTSQDIYQDIFIKEGAHSKFFFP